MRPWKILVVLIPLLAIGVSCSQNESNPAGEVRQAAPEKLLSSAEYVGSANCAPCHRKEYELWKGSDHQLAMQEANRETVLGNFSNSTFLYNGIQSSFYEREDRFFVRTDGADGVVQDYEIRYVFGVRPLQQYLIQFPGGRYQALSIAWDTRAKEEGGQRWFHLYPDEKIDHKDVLHWTGLYQNWNHMCADCHSTNVKKNYDAAQDRYATSWSEINVSCESCHGPGSRHVWWASSGKRTQGEKNGLSVSLKPTRQDWTIDAKTGTAIRKPPRQVSAQIETCAPCHSRRSQLTDRRTSGEPLADSYLPSFIESPLYFVDGQIREEVYEYASFLQSRMFHQGVDCSHCHDPHSQKLLAPENLVCASCHLPAQYDTPSHHFHRQGSAGARCVECHMPQQYYMVIDGRRDHSIRIPRPDLSTKLSTPNACSQCHRDQSIGWASRHVQNWYGRKEKEIHYGEVFDKARNYQWGSDRRLVALAQNPDAAVIVRAAAISELAGYPGAYTLNALSTLAKGDSSLIRLGVLDALEAFPPENRWATASHFLQDPRLSVRVRAAGLLSELPERRTEGRIDPFLQKAQQEYFQAQEFNADRPESHINRGNLYLTTANYAEAESAYQTALRIEPSLIQGYVNLADLYRAWGKDELGEKPLRSAVFVDRGNAEANHALGLWLIRQRKLAEALNHLKIAAENSPLNPRYSYVYAVALNSSGQSKEAVSELKAAHDRLPADRDILVALIHFCRETGDVTAARGYAEELVRNSPTDEAAARLLQELTN